MRPYKKQPMGETDPIDEIGNKDRLNPVGIFGTDRNTIKAIEFCSIVIYQ
jgi:hypothetical protein